ncbi:MAG UNVERIFIED_CONTAM: hypothetical protein LVT10_15405 [Anaerolineae bacterium]
MVVGVGASLDDGQHSHGVVCALVWIGVGGVLVLIPHFNRNGLCFGGPVYPFDRLHSTDRASVIGRAWTPPAVVDQVRQGYYPFFTVLRREPSQLHVR